jgi:hypothetical protein
MRYSNNSCLKVVYKPNLETLEEGDTLPEHLTEGKIYDVKKKVSQNYYMIKCDDGEIRYLYKEDFIPINKYRENQINNLLK